jgi:hypothetical protein
VFLQLWLADVKRWRSWSWKEVGSPEDYIVRYKSKWNEWQPSCTVNWSWILLRISALRIATGDSNGPAIWCKWVQCCLFIYRDTSWCMTADIPCLIKLKTTSFVGKEVWWSLSHDIAGILRESHTNHQVKMYCYHDYSQWSDSQNTDFALFKLIKSTNRDIKTQLASMWSISCNIQHLTQQQGQHKIWCSMLQKRTFHHLLQPNTAYWQSNLHDDVIQSEKATVVARQKWSERSEHCTAYDPKEAFSRELTGNALF